MPFRNPSVRRNVADNIRRAHNIPVQVSPDDILALLEELSFMDADEFHAYLNEEIQRLGDWREVVARNLSTKVH